MLRDSIIQVILLVNMYEQQLRSLGSLIQQIMELLLKISLTTAEGIVAKILHHMPTLMQWVMKFLLVMCQ